MVLQRGGGPDLAFRAYLLTAVRRLHVDKIRAASRLHTTDDLTPFDPGVPFRDTAVEGFENAAAARAFASLPERWQLVLWHTEVEGQKPAEVAPLLAMSANSVSALAYRAREGLRQAFLDMHVGDQAASGQGVDAACAWTHQNLGSYVRGGLARRDSNRIAAHLDGCRRCTAIYLELTEVNANLSGVLAPVLLGGAAAAYVASSGGVSVGAGGLIALLGRARDVVVAQASATTPVAVIAGVTATAVVGGALLLAVGPGRQGHESAGPPTGSVASSPPTASTPPSPRTSPSPGRHGSPTRTRPTAPVELTPLPGLSLPTLAAARAPDHALRGPTHHPTSGADQVPTGGGPAPSDPPGSGPGGAAMDLRVVASSHPTGPGTFQVRVDVTGLRPGASGTLTLTADSTEVGLTLDSGCQPVHVTGGTCALTVGRSSFGFVVVVVDSRPTTLTLVVRPAAGWRESNPRDNTTRVVLRP